MWLRLWGGVNKKGGANFIEGQHWWLPQRCSLAHVRAGVRPYAGGLFVWNVSVIDFNLTAGLLRIDADAIAEAVHR